MSPAHLSLNQSAQSMDSLNASTPKAPLRRRNSIATSVLVPPKLSLPTKPLHASSFPNGSAAASASTSSSSLYSLTAVDLELLSIKPFSYTSLKDLLPATAVQSPTAACPGCQSAYEISIRNRLVKQAAWAYLQPMSTSPESAGGHFFHRLWDRFPEDYLKNPVAVLLAFVSRRIIPAITRAFDRLLRVIRIRSPG